MVKSKLFNWIGGKKWLSTSLNESLSKKLKSNNSINCYIEPFAGGLGSFISISDQLYASGIRKVLLNDVNLTIINTYKHIKDNNQLLLNEYLSVEALYSQTIPEKAFSLHKTKQKEELKVELAEACQYFNTIKKEYNLVKNDGSIHASALFLFLMEHCFNSVYRENQKGEFNVPYNWEPGIISSDLKLRSFKEYHNLFITFDIEFSSMDVFLFLDAQSNLFKDALFYFDPPYLNETIGENKYNKDHFNKNHQKVLLDYYNKINHVVFSNHLVPLFEDFCNNNGFQYTTHFRNNIMNSDTTKRSNKIAEILAIK